jgi:hypothetical protein
MLLLSMAVRLSRNDRDAAVRGIVRLIPYLPLLFVVTLFLGYFAVLLIYAQALFRFPFDYDQGEGFELYDAIRLAHGQSIYLNNTVFPFYSSNYPPVYRLMLVPLIWLFGSHLWVGRIVTFACTLVIGLFVFLAARRQIGETTSVDHSSRWVGRLIILFPLLAALAFFAANYVYQIAPLARAHLPMVMFSFAGIYCIDCAFASEDGNKLDPTGPKVDVRPRVLVLGLVLLLIAGFTKLQAIDALAAGFGYLLLRKPRWCLVALAACIGFSAMVALILNAATQGQFWLNVVLANVNEYDIQRTWFFYTQWFQLQGALIVCSALYVLWDIVRALQARSFKTFTIWSFYFLAGAAMGMLTGKWGAGPTYLIAAIAASCVCCIGFLWRLVNLRLYSVPSWLNRGGTIVVRRYSAMALLCAAVFMVQASLNVHLPTSGKLLGGVARLLGVAGQSSYPPYPYYDSIGYTQLGHLLDAADTADGWELVSIARSVGGPVWSEEAMLTLNAGKDVVTNPTQLFNLSKSNMLDTSKMIAMINSKTFGAVIFRAQFYPQDVLIAIGQNYHWVRAVRMNGFDYQVLYPNGS